MVFDPRLHHRRSIRLRGHDYAGGGVYFVTICTEAKKCLFGEVIEGESFLNEAGRLVQKTWDSFAVNKLFSQTGTRLLHENFYEHIVRDIGELESIRDYIIHNPQRWLDDPENPESPTYRDW